MKLTNNSLKRLIKEEFKKVLQEAEDIDPESLSDEDVFPPETGRGAWEGKSPEGKLLSLIQGAEELSKRLKGGESVEEIYNLLGLEEDPKISELIKNMTTPFASLYSPDPGLGFGPPGGWKQGWDEED